LPDNNHLRRSLRATRRQISSTELQRASTRVCQTLLAQREFLTARRIAGYVGNQGEIDPMPLLYLAHMMGKQCYLPILHPFLEGRLWFARWTPQTRMDLNRFNIPEPVFHHRQSCKPQFLDLILVPMLGFDAQCHRLGMGGGFYDRTLSFRLHRSRWTGPELFGLAHEAQRCDVLQVAPWDVRMDAVFTGQRIYRP
jgi:5-formyltetrahydrofolate cyclo-ligase